MIFRILLMATLVTVNPLSRLAQGGDQPFDPLRLNIRLSPTALHPPSHLIKQQWMLDGYRLGRLGPQAPQAVIIEDDARRRVPILSPTDEGRALAYQVGALPVDAATRLRPALVCVHTRQCQTHPIDPARAP